MENNFKAEMSLYLRIVRNVLLNDFCSWPADADIQVDSDALCEDDADADTQGCA